MAEKAAEGKTAGHGLSCALSPSRPGPRSRDRN